MNRHEAAVVVALLGLAAVAIAANTALKWRKSEPQPLPQNELTVNLNLTAPALSACLNAFLRYAQGGPVSDYECRVNGADVELWGPNWSAPNDGNPPTSYLGAVRMEATNVE